MDVCFTATWNSSFLIALNDHYFVWWHSSKHRKRPKYVQLYLYSHIYGNFIVWNVAILSFSINAIYFWYELDTNYKHAGKNNNNNNDELLDILYIKYKWLQN